MIIETELQRIKIKQMKEKEQEMQNSPSGRSKTVT